MSETSKAVEILNLFAGKHLYLTISKISETFGWSEEELQDPIASLREAGLATVWEEADEGVSLVLTPLAVEKLNVPYQNQSDWHTRGGVILECELRMAGLPTSRDRFHHDAKYRGVGATVAQMADNGDFDNPTPRLSNIADPNARDPIDILSEIEEAKVRIAKMLNDRILTGNENPVVRRKQPDYDRFGKALPSMRVFLGESTIWPMPNQDKRPGPYFDPIKNPRNRPISFRQNKYKPYVEFNGVAVITTPDYWNNRGLRLWNAIQTNTDQQFIGMIERSVSHDDAIIQRFRADMVLWFETCHAPASRPLDCPACGIHQKLPLNWYCLACDRSGVDHLLPLIQKRKKRHMENQRKGRVRRDGLKGGLS